MAAIPPTTKDAVNAFCKKRFASWVSLPQILMKTKKEINMAKTKVVIYVSSGVVLDTKANHDGVEVTIFDVDNLKADGVTSKEIDKRWAKILDETHWDTVQESNMEREEIEQAIEEFDNFPLTETQQTIVNYLRANIDEIEEALES